jgi:phosphopantothenoylcysteine decarboxylase/phosphopantothenate--cysteine ligase
MRVLVTAGPTREHIDRVRYLTNASTGMMGLEVAKSAAAAGHEVVLVLGPTYLRVRRDPRITLRNVVTGLEMLAECREAWPKCDALVAAAAVSDYRPAAPSAGKPEKTGGPVTMELLPNPDILAELAATKGRRLAIGFALQVEDAENRAKKKLVSKNLDAVVLDDPSALGAVRADFRILLKRGETLEFPGATKTEIADRIVDLLATLRS